MPTISFYLLNPYQPNGKPKNTECRLYIGVIESRSKRVKIKTPFKIKPTEWNNSKQEARITCPIHAQVNTYILDQRQKILSAFLNDAEKDFHDVIDDKVLNNSISDNNNAVHSVFQVFISHINHTKQPGTVLRYRGIANHLRRDRFEEYDVAYFENLYSEFIKKGLLNDHSNKIFQRIRTFFQWAKNRGYHNNNVFDKNKIGPSKSTKLEIVSLTEAECQKMAALELNESDDFVRNVFLLSCHSGARISDLKSISPRNVFDDRWIFEPVKTRTKKVSVIIPFKGWCGPAKEYLQKVMEKPFLFSEPFINRQLKVIAKRAGISEPVKTTRMSGKNYIVRDKPKYEYISLHTGRRTFISILMNKGTPTSIVMKLTGINNLNTLVRYLNTDTDDIIRELERSN